MTGRRRSTDLAVLAALGVGVVALAAWSSTWALAREHTGAFATVVVGQLALSGLALAWVAWRRPPGRAALLIVIVFAAAARLVLVPHAPDVSGDVYRYVWDGRVQSELVNPYRHAPDAAALVPLRDAEVYPHINRRSVPTIYPPVAQATFLGLNLAGLTSVTAVKLAMALADIAAIGAMALLLVRLGLQPARVVLYAWHPLAILEVGRSGHVDAVAVLLMMLALLAHVGRRPLLSGALTAAAALAKFYAAAILPALLWVNGRRRWSVVTGFGLTAVVAYLPYLGVGTGVLGYLPGYLQEEGFASGERFYLLGGLSRLGAGPLGPVDAAQWYQGLVTLAMGGVAAWCWWRPPSSVRGAIDRSLLLLLVLVVLSTPTYPWYLLLVLALIPMASPALAGVGAIVASGAALLYLQWWLPGGARWPLHLTWGLGALALAGLAVAALLRRRRPGWFAGMPPRTSASAAELR